MDKSLHQYMWDVTAESRAWMGNYNYFWMMIHALTHWGRVTHICVSKLTSIASDNSLSPGRRQAIIWNNVGILLIGPLGTNFNQILIEIHIFSLKKIRLKMSSAKCRPFSLGLNVLNSMLVYVIFVLNSSPPVPHICVGDLGNKFQGNLNRNFHQQNAYEIAICQNGGHFVQGEIR